MVSRRVRGLVSRVGWGVADQALSSLTNVAVGILAARSLSPDRFGAFSLAFATYLLVLNGSRGLATDPLVVRFSGVAPSAWREGVAAATATATVFGVATGAVCVTVGLLLDSGPTSRAFLALGLTMPGLLLQDSWRHAFFAARQGSRALVNDLAWAVFLVPMMALAASADAHPTQWIVAAWGGAATLAGLVGIVQARVVPCLSCVRRWYDEQRDLGLRYLVENISYSAAGKLRFYGLGLVSGLAAVGALRGAELLLGPLNLMMIGIGGLMAIPEATRLARHARHRVRPFCMLVSSVLFVSAMVWGGVLVLGGSVFGEQLLGETWASAAPLLLPTTLAIAFLGVWCGAWVGLRGLGAAPRSLRAQAIGATVYLVAALTGALLADAAGAAWGSALGNLLAACVWWTHLVRAIDEAPAPVEGTRVAPVTSGA